MHAFPFVTYGQQYTLKLIQI